MAIIKHILQETDLFSLSKVAKHRPHKPGYWYVIKVKPRSTWVISLDGDWLDLEEVRNIVDPNRNIGGKQATKWKFKSYQKAEKAWIWLTLRYS